MEHDSFLDMRLNFLIIFSLLFLCGCSSFRQQGYRYDCSANEPSRIELTGLNAAMATAILDELIQNQYLNNELRKRKGTLFLMDVDPEVAKVIKSEMEHELPRIETDCTYFHEFMDSRTGKWARIVRVRTMSANSEWVVFEIDHAYGKQGGETTLVEVRLLNGVWKVTSRRMTGVA